eukprot:NODE_7242_length_579_cov_26.796226_g4139_i1.p2 GENE.NODE_7242_length_579_cov_26.796226_g4139_i1~~NODE_7242_length_579_cov_26.796226_g4139_i1.p2  ORF type:complete len:127 (+),score=3.86 NODE_7242_length_579_cov_26.796226_g4139_i1:90-470(+)
MTIFGHFWSFWAIFALAKMVAASGRLRQGMVALAPSQAPPARHAQALWACPLAGDPSLPGLPRPSGPGPLAGDPSLSGPLGLSPWQGLRPCQVCPGPLGLGPWQGLPRVLCEGTSCGPGVRSAGPV